MDLVCDMMRVGMSVSVLVDHHLQGKEPLNGDNLEVGDCTDGAEVGSQGVVNEASF